MKKRTTVYLESREQSIRLSKIAAELGFIISHGAGAGFLGSISELNRAIADGRVSVVRMEQDEQADKVVEDVPQGVPPGYA